MTGCARHPPLYNEIELAPPNARILALDLGKRRIGLAISDPLGITAQGLPNLERTNKRTDFAALEELIRQREVGMILMGNPINMGGSEGRQSGWVREFAGELERRTGWPRNLGGEALPRLRGGPLPPREWNDHQKGAPRAVVQPLVPE